MNSSPSFTATTEEDYILKFGLLDDCMSVLDLENFFKGQVEPRVGGFDLIWNNGPVKQEKQSCYTTKLGCFDDRVRQLKKLHKTHAKRLAAQQQGGH